MKPNRKHRMEKVIQYKNIVRTLLEEIAAMSPSTEEVETQVIMDEERGHYLLFAVGWEKSRWIYFTFFHVDVKPDGRVWLQHDGTDLRVAEQLIKRGIPKNNIVVGFQAPFVRPMMDGFAVA